MKRAKHPEAEALAIFEEDLAANRAMGEHGAALIPTGRAHPDLLQHRRAGDQRARHGSWGHQQCFESKKSISVIACETRPYLQGARLTAWECVQEGIPCTLITDNMAGHLMAKGEVDVVIVGADRIAANGDAANKIGTYMVAVLARRHGLPFYVAAPLSTFDPDIADGSAIAIEERADAGSHRLPRRALGARGREGAQPGVRRHAGGADYCDRLRKGRGAGTEPRAARRDLALELFVFPEHADRLQALGHPGLRQLAAADGLHALVLAVHLGLRAP